jgi:hypothetical protein
MPLENTNSLPLHFLYRVSAEIGVYFLFFIAETQILTHISVFRRNYFSPYNSDSVNSYTQ